MIQRVVTVQLADSYRDPASLQQIAAETRRVLAGAGGVLHVDVATAADARTRREWDLCILVRFATLEDAEAYAGDPVHRAYADVFLKPMRKGIRVWHFELQAKAENGDV